MKAMQVGLINLTGQDIAIADNLEAHNLELIQLQTNDMPTRNPATLVMPTLKTFSESLQSKRIVWIVAKSVDQTRLLLEDLKWYLSLSDIVILDDISAGMHIRVIADTLQALQIDLLYVHDEAEGHATIYGNRFAFNFCEIAFQYAYGNSGYTYKGIIRESAGGHV